MFDKISDLKSSMDRFIVFLNNAYKPEYKNLKSSMDRFIEMKVITDVIVQEFKIQYG